MEYPVKVARLATVYFPRPLPFRLFEPAVQFTNRTASGENHDRSRNNDFPDSNTFHDHIFERHIGTNGVKIIAGLQAHLFEEYRDFTATFSYDYEEYFRKGPIEERLHKIRVIVETNSWKKLSVSRFLGADF